MVYHGNKECLLYVFRHLLQKLMGPHRQQIWAGLVIFMLVVLAMLYNFTISPSTLNQQNVCTKLETWGIRTPSCSMTSTRKTTVIRFEGNATSSITCIEKNICRDPSSDSPVYFYNRTDFYTLLEQPVNYNASINHSFPVVPRTVHFCLFTNGNFTFKFYYMLAVMAAARFAKPEKIYFWHDNLPRGKYWEETKRRFPKIYLIHRDRPKSIRGNKVKVIEHVSDIVRLEVLLEYGGMYFDLDSIVVNPIDKLLNYDVTMGNAVSYVLANGIMFSKPWSDFFKIWHKEYKTFNDAEWGAHSVIKPFKLYKKYPSLIHVEPTSLCRPNFKETDYLFGKKYWNWRKNNYVVHLYMRYSGKIERNPENIKTWNTTVGSIMRYIYYSDSELIRN